MTEASGLRARRRFCLCVGGLAWWLAGCAHGQADADAPVVLASWYGTSRHGRRTASGEPFDMNALTAAHRRLPFGTRVRVRSVDTGREVVVRINDRGPWDRRREIDLSAAAARALGIEQLGVARVQLFREH
jgi:rare lipoprotein A